VRLAPLDQLVKQGLQDQLGKPVQQDLLDLLGERDQQVPQAKLDQLVQLVLPGPQAQVGQRV
jgi:hypothetical protein